MIQETLILPSLGFPYNGRLNGTSVVVRPLTTRAYKDFLVSASEEGIINLIDSCLVDCPLKADEFVYQDELAIYIKIRSISLGDIIPLNTTCPKCNSPLTVNWELMGMKCNYLYTEKYPYEIELPETKQKITLSIPTTRSQHLAEDAAKKRATQYNKNIKEYLPVFNTVVNIHVPDVKDITERADWYNSLPLKDAIYIDQIYGKIQNFGLEVNKDVKCSCGHEFTVPMSITTDFFRPSMGDFDGFTTAKGTLEKGPESSAISK